MKSFAIEITRNCALKANSSFLGTKAGHEQVPCLGEGWADTGDGNTCAAPRSYQGATLSQMRSKQEKVNNIFRYVPSASSDGSPNFAHDPVLFNMTFWCKAVGGMTAIQKLQQASKSALLSYFLPGCHVSLLVPQVRSVIRLPRCVCMPWRCFLLRAALLDCRFLHPRLVENMPAWMVGRC